MGKTSKNNKRYLKYVAIALLVVLLISVAFVILGKWEDHEGRYVSTTTERVPADHTGDEDPDDRIEPEYVLKNNIETFLVIGLDKFEGASTSDSYNNDKQADFLLLFVFDNESKTSSAIHINRDSMVKMSVLGVAGDRIDSVTKQIALSHTYGNGRDVSCRNTADSVSSLLLGMKVNHYISLTMDSVTVLNDLVGGVEVTVLEDFTGIDDTLVKGENVTLMGEHALNYVRTRYGLEDSSNNTRMKRQQQYVDALYAKIRQCVENDDEFIVDASLKMSDYIISDRSVTQLQELMRKFNEYEYKGIYNIAGESKSGENFVEFYPDKDSLKQTVIELFYKQKN